jgi:hypothetical protein
MVRWFSFGCVLGVLFLLGGCDSKPKVTKVSGTVELDGKPLDDGSISLFGEGGTAPEKFDVKNGKFEGEARPGKKKVQIMAFRQGKVTKMDKEEFSTPENYLPARYNSESTITADVTDSGINPKEFKVESK